MNLSNDTVKDWQARTLTHLTRLQGLLNQSDVLDGAVLRLINGFYPLLSQADKQSISPFMNAYRVYLENMGESLMDLGNDISFVDQLIILIGDDDGS